MRAAFAVAAFVMILAGCANSGMPSFPSAAMETRGQASLQPKAIKYLAVADYDNQIVVFDGSYHVAFTIEEGLNDPVCVAFDNRGNIYAANTLGGNVTEYDRAGKLTFTYASSLSEPGCVTSDSKRNVYVTDFNHNQPGVVQEYPQHVSSPLYSCMTGLANGGVAVDPNGDVFVTGNNPKSGAANILEYKGGLHGCRFENVVRHARFRNGDSNRPEGRSGRRRSTVLCRDPSEAVRPY
ncbi:MAG TPA: hypothetical protein VGF86_01525, partial [Candidatus Tumulicola sp.]